MVAIEKKQSNLFILNYIIPFTPYLASFLGQMILMILELVSSRLIGSHYGTSLYTWAAVIGVILCGNSLGSYWGGRIAEQKPSYLLLARLMILTALGCIFTLFLNWLLGFWLPLPKMNWPLQIFISTFILFVLPSFILGTLTPITAKLALTYSVGSHQRRSGIILGDIFAWGAIGSIIGTLLTGFFLIPAIGSTQILALSSLTLAVLAILFLQLNKLNQVHEDLRISNESKSQQISGTEGPSDEPAYKKTDSILTFKRTSSSKIPYFLAFLASFSLMMIEFLTGRLISRYYGNSLYSWTANIGLILVGITIGYFIGGHLAKNHHPLKFISSLFGITSLLVLTTIVNINFLWTSAWMHQFSLPWQILLVSTFTILFPAIALGSIAPINYQWALQDAPVAAPIIGSLNAWAIIGGFSGSLLTGFWFISTLGTIHTLFLLAFILAITYWWLTSLRIVATLWIFIINWYDWNFYNQL